MTDRKINLRDIESVKEFVAITNAYDYDIDVISGRYTVDAKSVLGIFSLNLKHPVEMRVHDNNCPELLRAMDKFIVK